MPAPEAYVLAGLLYAMSAIGLLVLLKSRRASAGAMAGALVLYGVVAVVLSSALRLG